MKIRTWGNFIKQGMHNIFRNRVMSFASVIAIMSALFILGMVLIIVFNLNHMAEGIESKVEITVFLKMDVSDSEIEAIQDQINNWEGVYEVDYISRKQALDQWQEELGDKASLLEGYNDENNPLPDKFMLKIEKPEFAEEVLSHIGKLSQVEKINYSREVADAISKIVNTTRLIGFGIAALLTIISMIIINNTIKITVYSRRREIKIMKYIGATDWYIRWPFIMEGFTLGIMGAGLAGGLLAGGYYFILENSGSIMAELKLFNFLELLPIEAIFYEIGLVFFVVASLVGIFASLFSIHKYLRA